MSFCDIRKHTPDQDARTHRAKYSFDSQTTTCALGTEFREELWGTGPASFQKEEPVETDDTDLVLNVELPDIHQCVATLPKALPSIWGTRSQRILVRFEYSVAEREAISVSNINARHSYTMFIVIGQPGIGALAPFFSPITRRDQRPLRKDRDFTLLLMRRRAYRLTTVLQVEPDSVILFHEGGIS